MFMLLPSFVNKRPKCRRDLDKRNNEEVFPHESIVFLSLSRLFNLTPNLSRHLFLFFCLFCFPLSTSDGPKRVLRMTMYIFWTNLNIRMMTTPADT